MTVRIDRFLCNGCGKAKEPQCMKVCPGDLFFRDHTGLTSLRDANDCWDCSACIKECPRQAIEMYLPVQIGGRGSTLKAQTKKDRINWLLTKPDGSKESFEIRTRNI